ncbi:PAS domain-containing protein [uncultured Sneathiella sp.]|uniref:PAS domain-containing protein n=1 Tax=uncultured Sneathiella sp. TaxID=879315 RepID=UPI002591F12D|nr:PAS domain-containing protein [uncultured Sneathiella sp.]
MVKEKAIEVEPRSDNVKKVIRLDATSVDEFKSPTIRNLYQWWESYTPELPTRDDFDISRHWEIAPSLYLIEAIAPGQYLFRLNGENVVNLFGSSFRGQEISLTSELPELRRLAGYLDTLVEEKKPGRCTGVVEIMEVKVACFETVDLPLLREDGSVGHLLGSISLVD